MQYKPQREAYGEALVELARQNPRVVALTADLAQSTRLMHFKEEFPERFFECGVSEQALVGIAAGLSFLDFIPFASSFGVFVPGRAFDHLRVSIGQNKANVKLIGSHAGFSNFGDGATAQAIEDIALVRSLPNMTILSPADARELKKAVFVMAEISGPVYMRMTRNSTPIFIDEKTPFEMGKAQVLKEGKDVTIVGTGPVLYNAILAAQSVDVNCEVINCSTIKPLDEEAILRSTRKTGCIVTVEEHNIHGGLGDAVSQMLSQNYPVPQEFIAIKDRFGQSARNWEDLAREYNLDEDSIKKAIEKAVARKRRE